MKAERLMGSKKLRCLYKGLSNTALKWIAVFAMVMDHLAFFFPDAFPLWFRWVGRVAAPIFMFCAAWGFDFTKDKKKYLLRLYIGSLVMTAVLFVTGQQLDMNFFKTLFQMLLIVYLIDSYRKGQNYKRVLAAYVAVQVFSVAALAVLIEFSRGDMLISIAETILLSVSLFHTDGGLFSGRSRIVECS